MFFRSFLRVWVPVLPNQLKNRSHQRNYWDRAILIEELNAQHNLSDLSLE